ncbi:MAG: hypothetical protein PHY73_03045 [Candidatus Omnitrophica bacterium]|nr:hypothetical protein [Candidatus Omnitrophota bacterium]
MLLKFLGIVWFMSATMLFLKPLAFKAWLKTEDIELIRKTFFRICILVGVWLLAASSELPQGKICLFVIILGFLSILKSIIFLESKWVEEIITRISNQSVWLLRLGACVHIVIALIIIFGA